MATYSIYLQCPPPPGSRQYSQQSRTQTYDPLIAEAAFRQLLINYKGVTGWAVVTVRGKEDRKSTTLARVDLSEPYKVSDHFDQLDPLSTKEQRGRLLAALKPKRRVICPTTAGGCGKQFWSTSPRAVYCSDCTMRVSNAKRKQKA